MVLPSVSQRSLAWSERGEYCPEKIHKRSVSGRQKHLSKGPVAEKDVEEGEGPGSWAEGNGAEGDSRRDMRGRSHRPLQTL